MPIERQQRVMLPKRLKDDILIKNEKIGELLGLEKVPLHTLAWKEPRLDLASGDCYPVVDVLGRIADLLNIKSGQKEAVKRSPGRPKVIK